MTTPPVPSQQEPFEPPTAPARAVVFDLDGTLADTLADIAAAANHVIGQYGRPPIETARYRYLAGQGLEYLIRHALGPELEHHAEAARDAFRAYYAQHDRDRSVPYPGVPELLAELAQRGVPMGILSNKPDEATRRLVAALFEAVPFAHVQGAKPELPLKPDPTSLLGVLRRMGLEPAGCLYVGDTRVDMEVARAAGAFAVGVTWGFRDERELRESGAQAIIHHPAELSGWLASHPGREPRA